MATNNSINNTCSSGLTVSGGAVALNSGTSLLSISGDAASTTVQMGIGAGVKNVTIGNAVAGTTMTLDTPSGTKVSVTNGVSSSILALPTTTSSVGQVTINSLPFLHGYGTNNLFAGTSAGNFTVTGVDSTGLGYSALSAQTSGFNNTAVGRDGMIAMTSGNNNVSVGRRALNSCATGTYNISIGSSSGAAHTGADSSNIDINNVGTAGDSHTLRIGNATNTADLGLTKTFIHGIRAITTINNDAVAVLIDGAGQLGTTSSSIRYKENVTDMNNVSSPIMKMRPVIFDFIGKPSHKRQVGLIAEEVLQFMPDLVVYNMDGLVESVKYHDLPVLLLNELQKLSKRVEELEDKLKG